MTKTNQRLIGAGAFVSLLLLLSAAVISMPPVEDAIFVHFVEQHLRAGDKALFEDNALRVLLCGTSAPFADQHRAQSCVAVIAGGRYYLVDTGPGSARNLMLWQLQGRELAGVFLTHFHSDHIGDLGEVNTNAWLAGHPGRCRSSVA